MNNASTHRFRFYLCAPLLPVEPVFFFQVHDAHDGDHDEEDDFGDGDGDVGDDYVGLSSMV